MASQRVFQLGLRRAAAPSFKIQPAGRTIQKRYVLDQPTDVHVRYTFNTAAQRCRLLQRRSRDCDGDAQGRLCSSRYASSTSSTHNAFLNRTLTEP